FRRGIPQRLPANPILNLGIARHVVPVLGELKVVEPLGDIARQDGAVPAFRRLAPVALARALAPARVRNAGLPQRRIGCHLVLSLGHAESAESASIGSGPQRLTDVNNRPGLRKATESRRQADLRSSPCVADAGAAAPAARRHLPSSTAERLANAPPDHHVPRAGLIRAMCVLADHWGHTMSMFALLLNLLWLFCGGLWMAAGWLVASIIMAITIIGIPWARAAFNIAAYTLLPFGQTAVSRADYLGRDDVGTGPF